MSHYRVLVLAPAGTTMENAEAVVEPLLAPYDETLEVAEHEEECACVGTTALLAGLKAAWSPERAAERDRLRGEFAALGGRIRAATDAGSPGMEPDAVIATIADATSREELGKEHARLEGEWRALCDAAELEAKRVTSAHELHEKPDPDCEQCSGTGTWRTTSNPKGYWDWWTVGGRWTGVLKPDYDPEGDERNYSDCTLCDPETRERYFRIELHASKPEGLVGLGAREKDGMWEVDVPTTREDPEAAAEECNGCGGTGRARNFHNASVSFDALPVAEVPEDFEWGKQFGAVVTPEGEWHQEGRVGWWAAFHREIDAAAWEAYVGEEVGKHPECVAVVVDCHI